MVNFGIIGFGLHAAKRLMPGFALAKNCRVAALSRRELSTAQQSAHKYEIPLAFDSAEALCRSPQVDAVFIATPNACHLQDVLIAAACGKPILCEKPMALNAKQCQQMVEAARKAGLLLGIAQVFRFEDSLSWFREKVTGGAIGKTVFARSEFSFRADGSHPVPGSTILQSRAEGRLPTLACIASTPCVSFFRMKCDGLVRVRLQASRETLKPARLCCSSSRAELWPR
jgi:predicted dehydrogenase